MPLRKADTADSRKLSTEERRQLIALHIVQLASTCKTSSTFLRRLKKFYGSLQLLGEGISRQTYALPEGLVLKLELDAMLSAVGTDYIERPQNMEEMKTAVKHPNDVPRIYASYFAETKCDYVPFSVLIARRAYGIKGELTTDDMRKPCFKKLYKKFNDIGGDNVGYIGRKMVVVDAGLGVYKP